MVCNLLTVRVWFMIQTYYSVCSLTTTQCLYILQTALRVCFLRCTETHVFSRLGVRYDIVRVQTKMLNINACEASVSFTFNLK